MTFGQHVGECHRCRREAGAGPCGGVCPCPVDVVDIGIHAKAGYCPHPSGPRFGVADPPPGWETPPPAGEMSEAERVAMAAELKRRRDARAAEDKPTPRDQWPRVVKLIAWRRREGETGVGDTIARLIPAGEPFKAWTKKHGIDCGCAERQARLNVLYPYQSNASPHSAE